jgi:hypothetical protein
LAKTSDTRLIAGPNAESSRAAASSWGMLIGWKLRSKPDPSQLATSCFNAGRWPLSSVRAGENQDS